MSGKTTKQRVAVIGAGPSGLIALKHLSAFPDLFEPVVFEQNFWPGGIWQYTDKTGNDEFGLAVNSASYNNLQVNIPKEIMEIPGFPFPKEWNKSYITRQQCLEYLNMFADHFNLRKHIRFHTHVRNVQPLKEVSENGKSKWLLTFSPVNQMSEVKQEKFDAVFVCNGHDSNPYIPDIAGMDEFQGRKIHSKWFRFEEHFDGLKVAVLGCHFSGEDISMLVAKFAKKVIVCHRRKAEEFPPSFPKEIEQRPPFVRMTKDSVVFPDGSSEKVDAIIFCTGYRYSFPFLNDGLITIKDERIEPIYKHMVHIEHQNLIFFGIPRQLPYFPHFHEMAKFAIKLLAGKITLPSEEEMRAESEAEYQARLKEGKPPIFAHYMGDGDRQTEFNAQIAKLGGFEPLSPVIQMIWDDVMDERYMNIINTHEFDYLVTGPSSYRCLTPNKAKSRVSKAENVVRK
ncbi:uncharacterized protein [Magallana gigas]|uniref:uncharacterized protein n=1 Tax=Magallana gigas TaxID=29159 RepID=UPI0033421AF1